MCNQFQHLIMQKLAALHLQKFIVVEKCYGRETYEELKFYETKERSISLDLRGWPVSEDVQIIIYHARWSCMQKRLQKVLIFGCGFHSNFFDGITDHLSFGLDEIDTTIESQDGIPINFKALISLFVDPEDI
jgi:hypothetical protein